MSAPTGAFPINNEGTYCCSVAATAPPTRGRGGLPMASSGKLLVMKKFIAVLPSLLLSALAAAQQSPLDVFDKVVVDVLSKQGGSTVCLPAEMASRDAVRAALIPRLSGVALNDPSAANAMAIALYTQFPCPLTPYRPELRAAKAEEVQGLWVFPEASQRLRYGPKSPGWNSQPGMPPVRCEGVAYAAGGDSMVAQVRGSYPCPTAMSMAPLLTRPAVEHWSLIRQGRMRIDRSDISGHSEEWDVFVVQNAFDFATVHFNEGDLLAYRRREPGNDFEASTLFRHLQRH